MNARGAQAALLTLAVLALPALALAQAPAASTGDTDAYLTNILRVFMDGLRDTGKAAAAGGAGVTTILLGWAVSQAAAKMALRSAMSQYLWQFCAAYAYAIYAWNAQAINAGLASSVEAAFSHGASKGVLSNPSTIMTLAYTTTKDLLGKTMVEAPETGSTIGNAISGAVTAVVNTGQAIADTPLIIALFFVLVGYWWTALTAMKTVIEANIKIIVGTTMTPLLVLPITRSYGDSGVRMVLEGVFELALKSLLVSLGFTALERIHLEPLAEFQDVAQAAGAAMAVACLCSGLGGAISFAMSAKRLL